MAYELTGNVESLATVTCTEDLRPDDFVYDTEIQQVKKADDVTKFEFTPLARPILTRTFAFVNEVNRLTPRARNTLLSVLQEREITYKGKGLHRVDGIILMDMNPSYGSLEWAFVDRIRAHLVVRPAGPEGRDSVDLQTDMLPTLRRVMLHRIAVKPEYASKYPTVEEWYTEEVEARIASLQENWKRAKQVYDAINAALSAGKDAEAASTLNRFRGQAKDIVGVKLAEILEPSMEAASEKRFRQVYSSALAMEKTGYSIGDIETLKQEPFPAKFSRELDRIVRHLELYLGGILQIKEDDYKKLISTLIVSDPSVVKLIPFPRNWGEETHEFPDGSAVTIRKEYGSYVVKYDCKTSAVATGFHEWRTRA